MENELKTVRLHLVVAPSLIVAIDCWRKTEPDLPNRSEAIRRLVNEALRTGRN